MEQQEQGVVKIADDVVSTIAGLAALETEGVAAMSAGISEGLAKRISGKQVHKGVTVKVGEAEAVIDLKVIVQYGSAIHDVCRKMQVNVKEAVESMTGLVVVEVNVKVEGVMFKDEKEQ